MKSQKRQKLSDELDKRILQMREEKASSVLDNITPMEGMGRILGAPAEKPQKDRSTESAAIENSALENIAEGERVDIRNNYHKMDNDVSDILAAFQTVTEQSIYRRLYRLSYGFGKNICQVGMGSLAKACNISSYNITVRKAIDGLIDKGHIEILKEHGHSKFGTTYRVYLPCEIDGINSSTIIKNSALKSSALKSSALYSIDATALESSALDNITLPAKQATMHDDATALENSALDSIGNIYNKYNIKDSLSPDMIIDLFYTGIGQGKISNEKRERALKCIQELKEEHFSEEDIAWAAEWTPANAKEKLYDFAIIKHTIGQALAVREKEEAEEEARQEKARIAAELEAKEAREREERKSLEEEKSKLPVEERKRLRLRAEQQIKDSGDYKPEYITEALVSSKENEIFKEEMR